MPDPRIHAPTPAARALAPLLAILLCSGCGSDLPPCDEEAARTVVFASDPALPAYAGQALVQVSCGNGTVCHSVSATRGARYGVPKGLDFDVHPAYFRALQGGEPDLDRLQRGQRKVQVERHAILREVETGRMPPGRLGAEVAGGRYRLGVARDAPALPDVASSEGQRILRQWLACDAPVVARRVPAEGGLEPGDPCPGPPAEEGDCIVGGAEPPDEDEP